MRAPVGRWAAGCGLALVAAGPMLLQQWHYLTPDAANVLVGSLVMLAVVRWERSADGRIWLAAAGALAMAIKAPNVVIVVTGCLYLLARAVLARRDRDGETRSVRQYVVAAATLTGGAAVASVTWLAISAALARPGITPMERDERVGRLAAVAGAGDVARFITPWDREPS